MSRKFKNTLMVIILLLSITSVIGTMYYAKTNTQGNKNQVINQGNMPNGAPPSMPNGDNNSSNNNSSGNNENSNSNSSMTPPEMPSGDSSSNNNSAPPEKPDDGNNGGTTPNMPNNSSNNSKLSTTYYVLFAIEGLIISATIMYLVLSKFNKNSLKQTFCSKDKIIIYILASIIFAASIVLCTSYISNNYTESTTSNKNINQNMPSGNNSNVSYSGTKEITKDTTLSNENYESTDSDQNALLASGNINVTASNLTVNKTGDSEGGDNTSFYGINSAILAKSGATLNLKNIKVSTNATGANGVFSYGGSATTNNSNSDGTTINISDSKITTSKDNSGGIMTTGGGTMNATNLSINTKGTSSAAIRSDRGGGTVNVNKGTYKTTGKGSPTIYSTADIKVKNAKLIATASEGVVIEGKNSVTLENVNLTDTNNSLNGQSTTYKNIFLYQSMSGDAANGSSKFTSKNSTITTNKGDTFYVTNTSSEIILENNKIINNDKTGNFLRAKADSWGSSGSNGGNVSLKMTNQTAEGNIVIDKVSTLEMTMKNGSSYKGTINSANSAKSIKLTLDKNSKITLTGNSYITSLNNADSTNSNINFNGYKLYLNGKAIN